MKAQNFQAELAQIVLDLIPSNSPDILLSRTASQPVKITNRTEFLASVHEQRVQYKARANMFTRISQRPPDKPNRFPSPPISRIAPEPVNPADRTEFLSAHEQRLQFRAHAYMESQRPPESSLQLQDYSRNAPPSP